MPNLRFEIEYDGTNYCGWQVQNRPQTEDYRPKTTDRRLKKKSIQETLEKTLQKILQEKVRLIASGRTDAGVHALGQVANFFTKSKIPLQKLQYALNGLLPADISVRKIEEAPLDFHSRFCAKEKTYRYTILNCESPSALLRDTVYFFPYPLNLSLMRREAKCLLGRHNFKSFQAADKKERRAVRTVKKINIAKKSDFIYIDITADGFLYNMCRNICGTLIEIGRGRFAPGSLKKILSAKDRKVAGYAAPAKGLCLIKVGY